VGRGASPARVADASDPGREIEVQCAFGVVGVGRRGAGQGEPHDEAEGAGQRRDGKDGAAGHRPGYFATLKQVAVA
jgi:hypothetical protein